MEPLLSEYRESTGRKVYPIIDSVLLVMASVTAF